MPFRQTIAAKIFGLAIILLLLAIALAGFLLYEVTRTKQDLTVVANFDVPLTQSLARLHEFGRLTQTPYSVDSTAEASRQLIAAASQNGEHMTPASLRAPVGENAMAWGGSG